MKGPAAERRRAAAVAGHLGDVDGATAAVHDAEPAVRATGLAAMERLGLLDPTTLAAGLGDPSPLVRRRAAELAAHHPEVSLLAALHDPDVNVVEMAAFASGEQGAVDEAVLARLIDLVTGHEDALVREAAVAALGAIGSPRALTAILAATHDKATVRRRAIIALAPFEGSEVEEALERGRTDRDWQVRQAAEDLLG